MYMPRSVRVKNFHYRVPMPVLVVDRARMRRRRNELGKTQEVLADEVGYARPASITQIETGRANPSPAKSLAIARALAVSVDWLLGEGPDDLSSHADSQYTRNGGAAKEGTVADDDEAWRFDVPIVTIEQFASAGAGRPRPRRVRRA